MYKKQIKLSILMPFMLTILISTNAFASSDYTRLAGIDRYETSAQIALNGWTQSDYAVLALGEDYPDALCAAPLAGKYKAPILLTETDSIPESTLATIKQLQVKDIFIVGGTAAISQTVQDKLTALGITTTRLAGQTRYDTSIAVAKQLGTVSQIAVVTGEDYADALSIAPIAVKLNMPIILVGKDSIPQAVTDYIATQAISKTYLIGKGTSIKDEAGIPSVTEINGADKYARNIAIISAFKNDLDFSTIYLATGESFADALSGSVLAGLKGNPLVLVGSDIISEENLLKLVAPKATIKVLGGIGAVTDNTVTDIETATTIISSTIADGTSTFTKALNGTEYHEFNSVQQTSDGGYIAAGNSQASDGDFVSVGNKGSDDAILVKFNSDGTTEWIKALGGTKSDAFSSVQQTSDGGYIAAGYSESSNGDFDGVGNKGSIDAILVKFSSDGITEWIKSIGGSSIDRFNSVQQTSDGGYIAAGNSESSDGDFGGIGKKYSDILVKFNKSGTTEWIKDVGGRLNDYFDNVQQTSDGGYIVSRYSYSNDGGNFEGVDNKGSEDAIFVKFDKSGTTEWIKDVGGTKFDRFYSVQQTSDGGYIAAGYSESSNGDFDGVGNKGSGDAILVKFDKSGTIEWIKDVGGTDVDYFQNVHQTTDGGYIAAGLSRSVDGDFANDGNKAGYEKMVLAKFKSDGTIEWVKGFDTSKGYGTSKYGEQFNSMQPTSDGGYVVAGASTDGATLIKILP